MASSFPTKFSDMSVQISPSLLWMAAITSFCAYISALTWLLLKKVHSSLPGDEKATVCWFVVSGVLNLLFIGDMFRCLLLSDVGTALEQDSSNTSHWTFLESMVRNSGIDSFTLYSQMVSAVLFAPLSFTVGYLTTTHNAIRHPLQIIVCSGQLYDMLLYCGSILTSHQNPRDPLLGLIEKPKDIQSNAFLHIIIIFLLATIPSILLHSSITTITRTIRAFQKISLTLSQRRKPTPMKPCINSRRTSTASITISKLDFEKSVSVVTRSGEQTGTSNYQIASDPKKDINKKYEKTKTKKAREKGKGNAKPKEKKKEKKEGEEETPDHTNPNQDPTTDSEPEQSHAIIDSYFKPPSSPSNPYDDTDQIPSSPIPNENASDDESLGEISIDKMTIMEGIRNRKLRSPS